MSRKRKITHVRLLVYLAAETYFGVANSSPRIVTNTEHVELLC